MGQSNQHAHHRPSDRDRHHRSGLPVLRIGHAARQGGESGLLRALGLDWSTLIGGVALEQGIRMGAGAIAGILAGLVAVTLFLRLLQQSQLFTGPDAPPFLVIGPCGAPWQVAVVLGVLFAATVTLRLTLLRGPHIGETVKLEG